MEQNMRSMLIVVNVLYNTRGGREGGGRSNVTWPLQIFFVYKNIILSCVNVFFSLRYTMNPANLRTWLQICSEQDCFVKFNLGRRASRNNFSSESPRNPRLSHIIQGVPRNMTVERRLKSCLIIDLCRNQNDIFYNSGNSKSMKKTHFSIAKSRTIL